MTCYWDDDFSGDLSKWTDISLGNGSATIVGGKLRLDNGTAGVAGQGAVELIVPLIGNFDVQVKVDAITHPATTGWYASLHFEIDSTHYLYVSLWEDATHTYYVRGYKNGGSELTNFVFRSFDSGWLRIVRTGSSVRAYYCDGATFFVWTALSTAQNIGSGDGVLRLRVVKWSALPHAAVDYDLFVINSGCPNSPPVVVTNAATDIATTSATGNGEVTSDGGSTITERGFCWSTSANPTTADDKVTVSGTVGSFSETMSSLSLGTLYHYRAYAINSVGTTYGDDSTFTTIGYPNVVTNAVTDIGIDAAVGHGSNDTGGGTITERGLCWGTSADPDTTGDHVTAAGTTGSFSGDLTGLSIGTHYFVRAYATNSEVGTAYGENVEFTTIALPVVETLTASDVTAISATGNGNVTSAGGGTISERGFVWSLSANPTTADDKLVVAGTTGTFFGAITGLTQATTYHYRAYAINEAGTAYGDDLIILTTAGLPVISTGVVTTGDVTNISNVSSIAHGNVLSDGGSTITSRGICYALTDTPTLADNVATATGTLGEFTATLTGLVKGTTYYYRAFATNAAGTAYGGIAHFVAGFESGIVTPTPATPKTIFPELPPKLRFKLDDEYPGFYYWYTAAKKFWSTVSFKGGSFTLSVGTSTIVADARTLATSVVVMHPTNAAAAALTPYVSAKTAGTGFTLTHGIAAGTETFDYILYV